ncbi:RHS repeat-associated core domain-containing protein [Marinobacterium iners]|uniref:RHS repeat-associated core domain-containing protein n=1 Tax=Marinobacterium iners TaxID=48076 RepID=UPI003BF5629D
MSRANDNQIVWRWDNDPFGRHTANEDPDGDSQLFTFSLRYPGQYYDEETGLHYNYFRDYDPSTGRYIESDPIGLEGGLNTYLYVGANPLQLIDPFGLEEYSDDFVGPLPPSGYYTSEMTPTRCGNVPPSPPGAFVDINMWIADRSYNPFWFKAQVRGKAPWDYKQKGRKYEDFGNFNYGATGSAFGFPDQVLYRFAGWANQEADPTRTDLGSPYGGYPYGDDPADQEQVKKGIEYCECMGY